ncbi:MAG: hypothetical protein R3C19_08715 [Planctomycetaceae bacterium]
MKFHRMAVAGWMLATVASLAVAQDEETRAKAESERPADKPGWVVVEETWWYPLRFESAEALESARYHFRRNEEKAAATEVRKAMSWLKYAAGHAMPITREKLNSAMAELSAVATDLDAGAITDAARMDSALAAASHALAEWHYFKAKESLGKDEAGYAAQHLEAAAEHLRHAADSAHYEYGPDTISLFEQVDENGRLASEQRTVDNNLLGKHLDGIEMAVKELGETLKSASANVAASPPKSSPKSTTTRPAESPGWVIVEEDWWHPLRYDFLDALQRARIHYRAQEQKKASDEIEKAVTWLKYAENHAEADTASDLSTARAELNDFSEALQSGQPVAAKSLDAAFARASAALAKHHHFRASKALAVSDLKTAAIHLMAAADHVRAAAHSANHEYGPEFSTIYDRYAPYGHWDETIEFTPDQIASNLTAIEQELAKLAEKLRSPR